jgi:hypothetical protein
MNENQPEQPSATRRGRIWKNLIAFGVVLIILGMLFWPAMNATRSGPPHPCRSALRTIANAMLVYHEKYGCFPPAYIADKEGRPMHSWRVLLLPFMDAQALYDRYRFDEPWDSPHNLALAESVPVGRDKNYPVFHCPQDRDSNKSDTSYVMVVGSQTISDGPTSTRISDFTDGLTNTIVIVEMSESGIHWMEPRDLRFDGMSFKINDPEGRGIRSKHPGGANVSAGDASVHWIQENIDAKILKGLLTRNGGERFILP